MSAKGKRVIFASGKGKPLNIEGVAGSAITPGAVLRVDEIGEGLEVSFAPANRFGELLIVADKDQARSKSVDENWTVAENMVAITPRSDEFINILVYLGQTLSRGSALARFDMGLLKLAITDGNEEIVGFSDEEIVTSEITLVRVRIA